MSKMCFRMLGDFPTEELHILLRSTAATLPPIQWVHGAVSLGLSRPGKKVDRSARTWEVLQSWGYVRTFLIQTFNVVRIGRPVYVFLYQNCNGLEINHDLPLNSDLLMIIYKSYLT